MIDLRKLDRLMITTTERAIASYARAGYVKQTDVRRRYAGASIFTRYSTKQAPSAALILRRNFQPFFTDSLREMRTQFVGNGLGSVYQVLSRNTLRSLADKPKK